MFWALCAINQSEYHLTFPLKASCAHAMADSLFTRWNLQVEKQCFSSEETDLLVCKVKEEHLPLFLSGEARVYNCNLGGGLI